MLLTRTDKKFKAGIRPSPKLMAAIGTLGKGMAKAGVLVEAEGLAKARNARGSGCPEGTS